MTPQHPVMLTTLEERLASPQGPALQRELSAQLAELELRLRGRLSSPLPKSEFEAVQAALEAAVSAQRVVRQWATASAAPSPGDVAFHAASSQS